MTAAFFVLIVSGDNVFARHVGMDATHTALSRNASQAPDHPSAYEGIGQGTGKAPQAQSSHRGGNGDGAAHLLHLLGACLAILYVGALALRRRGSVLLPIRAESTSFSGMTFAWWLASARRSPPPLSPPRASPVIRT